MNSAEIILPFQQILHIFIHNKYNLWKLEKLQQATLKHWKSSMLDQDLDTSIKRVERIAQTFTFIWRNIKIKSTDKHVKYMYFFCQRHFEAWKLYTKKVCKFATFIKTSTFIYHFLEQFCFHLYLSHTVNYKPPLNQISLLWRICNYFHFCFRRSKCSMNQLSLVSKVCFQVIWRQLNISVNKLIVVNILYFHVLFNCIKTLFK